MFDRSAVSGCCLAVAAGICLGLVLARGSIAYATDCPAEETRIFEGPVVTVVNGAGDSADERASWPDRVWLTPTKLSTEDQWLWFQEPP